MLIRRVELYPNLAEAAYAKLAVVMSRGLISVLHSCACIADDLNI